MVVTTMGHVYEYLWSAMEWKQMINSYLNPVGNVTVANTSNFVMLHWSLVVDNTNMFGLCPVSDKRGSI
jgi:hypothetical protein